MLTAILQAVANIIKLLIKLHDNLSKSLSVRTVAKKVMYFYFVKFYSISTKIKGDFCFEKELDKSPPEIVIIK